MEDQGSSKVIEGAQQAITLIQRSKDFIGGALQSCPPASLAWAGVCLIVLPAVINGLDQPLQKCKGLDYVIDRMEWYIGLHQLLLEEEWEDADKFNENRSSVQKRICNLYRSLIEYQVTSVCTLFVDVMHAMLNIVKEILAIVDWEAKIKDIKNLEAELDGDITKYLKVRACESLRNLVASSSEQLGRLSKIYETMKNLYETERSKSEAKARDRIRNRIARFDGTGYENTFEKIADREGSTGDWLLKHDEYVKWKSSKAGLLVIEANPGRGKSVLAKSVVKELKTDKKIVCYFFFTGGSKHTRATTALRAILYQLFDQRNDIAEAVGDVIGKRKEESFNDIGTLWEVFDSATEQRWRGDIICIFDALDECELDDARDLLRRLKDKSMPIKTLCTTRPNTHIPLELETLRDPQGTQRRGFFNIKLEDDYERLRSLSNDIDSVIDNKFDAFAKKYRIENPQLKEELRKVLKSHSEQRTYLWVELIFKYLDRAAAPTYPRRWLGIINKLPVEINPTYVNFLEAVSEGNRGDVRRMFAMLVAAYKPLDVRKMNTAVNISELDRDFEEGSSDYFRSWITENCGFLVEVFDQKLYFIHQTARDFLLDRTATRPVWLHPFDIPYCHLELAKSCISYLQYVSSSLAMEGSGFLPSQDLQSANSVSGFDEHYFLKYAAFYGLAHVREAETMPEINQDLVKQLNRLSTILELHYELTGEMDTLMIAIGIAELAVSATVDHLDLAAESKKTLGGQLGRRYERTGTWDDLERAVKLAEEALEAASPNHPDQAGLLENLGDQPSRLYERTGAIYGLNRVVKAISMVLDATPLGRRYQAHYLNKLGYWLGTRFERTGAIDDLERAVELTKEALKADPNYIGALNNLGNQLSRRFQRTGAIEDLNLAIKGIRIAVDATPLGHRYRAIRLSNLGTLLNTRFERTQEVEDFAQAVEFADMAVVAIPFDSPYLVGFLSDLGYRLGKRFEFTGLMDDLDDVIIIASEAVNNTPIDHPDRARLLNNLGNQLSKRFKLTGSMDDLDQAISVYQQGLDCRTAPPSILIDLARQAACILASQSNWEESSLLLQEAVDVLSTVYSQSSTHTDRQRMPTDLAALTSMAAAIALNAGEDAHHALQLLELGRGTIANILMDMRGDISDLKRNHPSLADEFISLRDEIDSLADRSNFSVNRSSWEPQAKQRRETDQKFAQLITRIRAQSGFHNFLLAPTADELMAAADPGPIIVFNLSHYRCDAFLIERDRIRALELPGLTMEGVQERAQKLQSSRLEASSHITSMLEWLWDVAARPSLDALGFKDPISDNWPRVWWIPTGLLSQFPLHAAGHHSQGSAETVLDRVMSSYAFSVKALIYERRHHDRNPIGPPADRALLVAMPETPDSTTNPPLPFAAAEVEILKNLCLSLQLLPITSILRKNSVLSHLQACKIFHFAGHVRSDPMKPSQSCLLLEDWESDPLTVRDLLDCRPQDNSPFLGYLSASSTAANEAERVAVEGIHFVSAFHLAGFRHVVGTLGAVSGKYRVGVARVLYETIRDEGMTDLAVCRGLHRAVRALRGSPIERGQQESNIDYHWVSYVHFGV